MSRRIAGIIVALVVIATSGVVARGVTVPGTNTVLDGNGGMLFIPLDTTGVLNGVGTSSDTVTLVNTDSASGWVEFVLTFDLNAALPDPLEIVDFGAPAVLTFDFADMDFKPVLYSAGGLAIDFRESMQLAFLGDPGDVPGGPDLTINNANYMTYKTTPGAETNGIPTSYEVSLQGDLGVADFSGINDDKVFGLWVKLLSNLESTGTGLAARRNTDESFAASLDFSTEVVPEPATMALMGVGLVVMGLLRRKHR